MKAEIKFSLKDVFQPMELKIVSSAKNNLKGAKSIIVSFTSIILNAGYTLARSLKSQRHGEKCVINRHLMRAMKA